MSARRRLPRWSELLLRLAVGEGEIVAGLLGDLREEFQRPAPRTVPPTSARAPDSGVARPTAGADAHRTEHGPRPAGRTGIATSYDRIVLSLAASYAVDRLRRRLHRGPGERGPRRSIDTRRSLAASLIEDFRHAARLLRRRPAFATAVMVTLGLGFGAAAAVLSVAYGVWLRPLPFAAPGDLVRIYEVELEGVEAGLSGTTPAPGPTPHNDLANRSRISPPLLEDLRATDWASLSGVTAVSGIDYDWEHDDGAERLGANTASRGVFDLLGLTLVEGRAFSTAPGTREAVLGEGFWRRAFGGSTNVIGKRSLTLDGERYLIVGVVPDGLPYPEREGEIWTPFDLSGDDLSEGMRGARYLDVIGRLRPGATLAAARAELDAFVRDLGSEHPNHAGWGATAVPLHADLVRPFVGILQLLIAAAAVFLLIACANVAGLVATRRVRDRNERGLRRALGASRARVLRQEIAEMLLLGAGGAVLAVMLALWAMVPLRRLAPADLPRLADIRLDPLVTTVLAAAVLLCGALVALIGQAMAGRDRGLARVGHHTSTSGTTPRSVLMVAQVALTTVLLLGGGGLAAHFRGLAAARPGFAPAGVAAAPVSLSARAYADDAGRLEFFHQVLAGLQQRGHPAALGVNPPVGGSSMRFGYRAGEDAIGDGNEQHWGQYHVVSPGYFEILGIPLLTGRGFDARDRDGAKPVVIISEALARAHFEGDPVGGEMLVVGTRGQVAREIVGVVGSVAHFGPDREPPPEVYVPFAQEPWARAYVVVRPGDSYSPADLREVVAAIDPAIPAPALFPYTDFVRTWFAPLRFQLTVVGLLAAAGATLALIGLYALVAFVVAGRTREIGIRVALGETALSVFTRVVGRGLALAGGGVTLGVIAALALRGAWRSLGSGADLDQPVVLLAVVGLVLAAACAASAWPARRATAVDPVETLRRN